MIQKFTRCLMAGLLSLVVGLPASAGTVPPVTQSRLVAVGGATSASVRQEDILGRIRTNAQRGGIPITMPSPTPVGTLATSAVLTKQYLRNSGAMTYAAATWVDDTTNLRASPVTADTTGTGTAYTVAGSAARATASGSYMFWSDAPAVELEMYFNSVRLYQRNELTRKWEVVTDVTSDGTSNRRFIPINPGSALPTGRLYRVDGDISTKLVAIRVGPTYTVWPYVPDAPVRTLVFGDSYAGGAGATSIYVSQFRQWGFALGLDDVQQTSLGGTGFATAGSSISYFDHYVADVIQRGPFDLIVILGSGNDYNANLTTVTSNAAAMYDAVHAAFPDAVIIATNSWNVGTSNSGSPQPSRAAVSTAIEAAWVGRPWLRTIDMRTWIDGTGKVGTTTGDGNADRYVSSDGIHPPQDGQDYRTLRLVAATRAVLGLR